MLDNDGITYSYQKPAPHKLAERALITLERTQKLDLLVHLLTNLRQPLVVCGPQGIGKTTLLQTLIASRGEQRNFCQLQGSSMLSFESILQQLSRTLNIFGSSIQLDLGALCDACQQQQAVLIIDDAGDLMPGLIGELIGFAEPLNGLRLVFAMTNDEFLTKSSSDSALEDCHVIELPPLNRKQCRDYLQNLSTHPAMPLTFNGISDALVDDLFHQTHGIPGRILAELPKLDHYQTRQTRKWWLTAAATVLLAIGGWGLHDTLNREAVKQEPPAPEAGAPVIATPTTLPTDFPTATPEPTPPLPAIAASALPATQIPVSASPSVTASPTATPLPTTTAKPTATVKPTATSKPTTTPTSTPLPTSTAAPTATPLPSSSPTPVATATPSPLAAVASLQPTATASVSPSPTATPSPSATPTPLASPSPAPAAKAPALEKPEQSLSDQEWIESQPPNNFTLQVMTLSNRDGVRRFMKKYAEYGESLKYFTVRNGEQERFILIYGSFDTVAEAKRYKEIMPGEFKQALEKRFRTIQKESRR